MRVLIDLSLVFCGFSLGMIFCNSIWKKRVIEIQIAADNVMSSVQHLLEQAKEMEEKE